MKIKYLIAILTVFSIFFTGCRKRDFVPFGENLREGVVLYIEVTEKTPQEVSDLYYGLLRENLEPYSGIFLPERIDRPWAFGFLGFNPINGEVKFIFVADEKFPETIEGERDGVENMVIFRDNLNRETGGYTLLGSKAYVYSGSSSYSVLKALSGDEKLFHESDDFKKMSDIYSRDDWLRIYIPGTVFSLLDMVPSEFRPVFMEGVRAERIKGFAARVSGGAVLSLKAVSLVDTGEVRAEVSFSGWEPKKAHEAIARMFLWNLL